ncbi:MAG: oxidoreductase, partial [Planctomycetota bacterium]|nr:oxidoreductase [Planctomycetota bacterium]
MPEESINEFPVLWFQGASCSGCSVSLLNSSFPSVASILLEPVLPGKHLNLRFHSTIMAGSGEPAISAIRVVKEEFSGNYILILEGSIQERIYCGIGEFEGKELYLEEEFKEAAERALAIIAYGTCASYGGIPAAGPNVTKACGVGEFLKKHGIRKPYINIPGCPPHPDWFVGTVASVLLFGLPKEDAVDEVGRPKRYYGKLVHDNCPRRAFFDTGRFCLLYTS